MLAWKAAGIHWQLWRQSRASSGHVYLNVMLLSIMQVASGSGVWCTETHHLQTEPQVCHNSYSNSQPLAVYLTGNWAPLFRTVPLAPSPPTQHPLFAHRTHSILVYSSSGRCHNYIWTANDDSPETLLLLHSVFCNHTSNSNGLHTFHPMIFWHTHWLE